MAPVRNGKKQRCEGACCRVNFGCLNGLKRAADLPDAVLADEPSPVGERSVIDELHNHRLLIAHLIEAVEVIGPEKRPEVIRQAPLIQLDARFDGHGGGSERDFGLIIRIPSPFTSFIGHAATLAAAFGRSEESVRSSKGMKR
jgi:hypothetical protein